MYVPHARLDEAFRQIKLDAVHGSSSVLILLAPTVDALCACRILVSLLQSEFVSYKLVPVLGYDDLARANELYIKDNAETQSVVLLDCGALVDVGEFFQLSEQMTVYVIDSHRPYNLTNLYRNDQVFVLDDGDVDEAMGTIRAAFELAEGAQDLDADEVDEAEEADAAESDDASTAEDGLEDDEDEDEDDAEEEADADGRRRRSPRSTPRKRPATEAAVPRSRVARLQARRMRLAEAERLLHEYYTGSWHGTSVASMLYAMATQLGKDSRELLWWALVGLTDQYISDRIPLSKYSIDAEMFREEVSRHCGGDAQAASQQRAAGVVSASEELIIRGEDEFRFILFRHWSLWESMYHSSYVANRLGVWKEEGQRRLSALMAKMGIPLQQCRERYSCMAIEHKRDLREKLRRLANDFNLGDISFSSFSVQCGFRPQMAAADVVHAVSALLEAGPSFDAESRPISAPGGAKGTDAAAVSREELWTLNVYRAYDALDTRNVDLLHRGLQLSMTLQRAISRQVEAIIKKSDITSTRVLRFAVVKDASDLQLFVHPFTLSRLALFLHDAIRQSNATRPLPFLLAAMSEPTDTYVIVGLSAEGSGDGRRNRFGMALREAAEHSRAQVKHDGFEMGVIEVKRADFTRFMESLQVAAARR